MPTRSPEIRSTPQALERHVTQLAGVIGERNIFRPEAYSDAADYIEAAWRDWGYEVVNHSYNVRGQTCRNIEVSRIGAQADRILLIGAHYDSVFGSPGANDNGSGVAALLELSRLFATSAEPAVTVRFVAFANEEPPFFATREQGSAVYAKAARKRGDDIRLMVCLETIGYFSDTPGSQSYPPFLRYFFPDTANYIGFVSNFRSRRLMVTLANMFRSNSEVPAENLAMLPFVPGVTWSDHRSFWKQGFRAVMVTDTAFYRYPYYHTADDTPDKLSYRELARVTSGLHRALAELAASLVDDLPR